MNKVLNIMTVLVMMGGVIVSVRLVDMNQDLRSRASQEDGIIICHKTGSDTNPGNTIRVNENAVQAHLDHGDSFGECDSIADSSGGDQGSDQPDSGSTETDVDTSTVGNVGDNVSPSIEPSQAPTIEPSSAPSTEPTFVAEASPSQSSVSTPTAFAVPSVIAQPFASQSPVSTATAVGTSAASSQPSSVATQQSNPTNNQNNGNIFSNIINTFTGNNQNTEIENDTPQFDNSDDPFSYIDFNAPFNDTDTPFLGGGSAATPFTGSNSDGPPFSDDSVPSFLTSNKSPVSGNKFIFKIKPNNIDKGSHSIKVALVFLQNGKTVYTRAANATHISNGVFQGEVTGVDAGQYQVFLKTDSHLGRLFNTVNVVKGTTNWDFTLTRLIVGDFNGDNQLNIFDVGEFLAEYTNDKVSINSSNQKFDVNHDNIIDKLDLDIILANYRSFNLKGETIK